MKKIIMFLCMTLCFMEVSIAQLHFYINPKFHNDIVYVIRFEGDVMYMVYGHIPAVRDILENNPGYFENMTERTPHAKGIVGTTSRPSPVNKFMIDSRINVSGRIVYSTKYWHPSHDNYSEDFFWSVKDDYSSMKELRGKYPGRMKEYGVRIEVPEESILAPAKVDDDVLKLFDD